MTDEIQEPHKKLDLFYLFSTVYGPYAFGVASLVLIWFSIVQPELNRRAMDFEHQIEVIERLVDATNNQEKMLRTMEQVANTMNSTAEVMERAIDKLEWVQQ